MPSKIRNDRIIKTVARNELITGIPGDSVIAKVIAGNGVVINSTGADSGTGDVTIGIRSDYTHTFNGGGSGAPPFITTSTTKVANLNSDYVDGIHGDYMVRGGDASSSNIISGVLYDQMTAVETINRSGFYVDIDGEKEICLYDPNASNLYGFGMDGIGAYYRDGSGKIYIASKQHSHSELNGLDASNYLAGTAGHRGTMRFSAANANGVIKSGFYYNGNDGFGGIHLQYPDSDNVALQIYNNLYNNSNTLYLRRKHNGVWQTPVNIALQNSSGYVEATTGIRVGSSNGYSGTITFKDHTGANKQMIVSGGIITSVGNYIP